MGTKGKPADPGSQIMVSEGNPSKILKKLGEAMVVRHLQVSWPKPRQADPSWFRHAAPLPRYLQDIRTIAVVGAGASLPILSIAEELADELEAEVDQNKDELKVELERLVNVYGLNKESFETRLAAMCRTPEAERRIRKRISEEYRHRFPILLTYEYLAHLMHHRFLDAVISFNFDELLDQSIEDELGPDEYTRVVTERDLDPGNTLATPLYIKMHGTAAEPDSLRFTRERYYTTPHSIVDLVERQFDVEHLVLLNLGFAMASFDFQYLLRKPKHLEIFHLDPYPLSTTVEGIEIQRAKERDRLKQPKSAGDTLRVYDFSIPEEDEKEHGVPADFLEELMGQVMEATKQICESPAAGPASWRRPQRHEAIVRALPDEDAIEKSRLSRYLRRRAILEVAFAAAKGRGVISITAMVNDRCGRYYDLYAREAGIDCADSWSQICLAGGLVESEEFPDTYEVHRDVIGNPLPEGSASDIHRLRLPDPKKLTTHLLQRLDLPTDPDPELRKLLIETLTYLQAHTEIEVHSRDDRVCSKIFDRPTILPTLTALQGWTRELIEMGPKVDKLLVVAESGGWLLEEDIAGKIGDDCRVELITAFDQAPEFPDHFKIRKLPWGRHNRHMTVICSNGRPRAAIYFVRRLRAATITPVYVSSQNDLTRVKTAFETLWREAGTYERELKRKARRSAA